MTLLKHSVRKIVIQQKHMNVHENISLIGTSFISAMALFKTYFQNFLITFCLINMTRETNKYVSLNIIRASSM